MKVKFLFVTFSLLLFSCKKEVNENIETANDSSVQTIDSIKVESQKSKTGTKILLASTYRIYENEDDTKELTKNWFELYEEKDNYFLDKADYSITNGTDECTKSQTKTIKTRRKTLLLIDNSILKKGKVDIVRDLKNTIWPEEEFVFVFKGKTFSLKAEGKILNTEQITDVDGIAKTWHEVSDYKLYLKSENSDEELIINEPSFNDTFVKLLFVGDIDNDGQPDFIFDAPRDYEENRVLLFLSSDAMDGKIVPKSAEISIQFDC